MQAIHPSYLFVGTDLVDTRQGLSQPDRHIVLVQAAKRVVY